MNLAREIASELGYKDDRDEEISIYNELLNLLEYNQFLHNLIEKNELLTELEKRRTITALEKFYRVSYKKIRVDDIAHMKTPDFDTAIGLIALFALWCFRESSRNRKKQLKSALSFLKMRPTLSNSKRKKRDDRKP